MDQELLKQFVSGGFGGLLVLFLLLFVPQVRDWFLNKLLENHKHKLAREFFKFEHVHKRRFEVIEELHQKLLDLEKRVSQVPLDIESRDSLDALWAEMRDTNRFFESRSLFLAPDTYKKVKDFIDLLDDVAGSKEEAQFYRSDPLRINEYWNVNREVISKMKEEAPKLREALQLQLRKELGSDDM